MQSILPVNQQLLLKNFLLQFLPLSSNKRKYSHNEFCFVHSVMAKIFFQHAEIKISDTDLASCLSELGYSLFVREGESGLFKNELKRSKKKKKVRVPCLNLNPDIYLYISISSKAMLELKRASGSLAYQKNPEKLASALLLKEKITHFFRNTPLSQQDSAGKPILPV